MAKYGYFREAYAMHEKLRKLIPFSEFYKFKVIKNKYSS